jgi:DNA-directed RNA polymerase specialized sigma24 family protein
VEPEGAFDALYREAAGPLRRQVYVLTGDRELAGEAVGRAFDTAWQQWPEVARDSDPVGWLRAAAHTYALAPWQGLWQRARRRKRPPVPEGAWWRALLRLPPERRRALLLHDGLGMSLARTAAEVEASTTAAASRVIAARRALAAAASEEYDGGDAGGRLAGLLDAAPADEPPAPEGVREASERAARRRTYASFGAAGAVLLLTTVCMVVAPQPVDRPDDGPARQQAAQPSSPAGPPAP